MTSASAGQDLYLNMPSKYLVIQFTMTPSVVHYCERVIFWARRILHTAQSLYLDEKLTQGSTAAIDTIAINGEGHELQIIG